MTGRVTYEISVEGHLDEHWAGWLGDADVVRKDDGTTTVVAVVVDQAAVHGILTGLRDIGVTLLSLRRIDPAPPASEGHRRPGTPPLTAPSPG